MIRTAITSHLAEGKIVKLSEIHIKQMRRSVAERKRLELVIETSHTRRQAPKVYIQLIRERLSEKICTRQSQMAIWDMTNTLFLATVAVEPTFVAFLLALANICP